MQTGGDTQVQAQIAVGGLADVQRAVHIAQRVRVLQVGGQAEQRHDQHKQQPYWHTSGKALRGAGPFSREQLCCRSHQDCRAQPAQRGGAREIHEEGECGRKPHQQDQPRAQPEPQPDQRAFIPKQRVCDQRAAA